MRLRIARRAPQEASRAQPPSETGNVALRRNEAAIRCDGLHVTALVLHGDDDLAGMLADGWHETVCGVCGATIQHTTVEPAMVTIAEAIHALGHNPRRDAQSAATPDPAYLYRADPVRPSTDRTATKERHPR